MSLFLAARNRTRWRSRKLPYEHGQLPTPCAYLRMDHRQPHRAATAHGFAHFLIMFRKRLRPTPESWTATSTARFRSTDELTITVPASREGIKEGLEYRKEKQAGARNIGGRMIIDKPAEEEAGDNADGDNGGDDSKRGTVLVSRECRHGGKAKIMVFFANQFDVLEQGLKGSIDELVMCCSADRDRFERELIACGRIANGMR
jgi:hypothetical protein